MADTPESILYPADAPSAKPAANPAASTDATDVLYRDVGENEPAYWEKEKAELDAADKAKAEAEAEEKPAEKKDGEKPETRTPEQIDLHKSQVKSDLTIDPNSEVGEAFAGFVAKKGMSSDEAKELAALENQHRVEYWEKQSDTWFQAAKSDDEIGGDNWDPSVGAAKSALDKFGTPELKEALRTSRYGNHPELIRFCARVGRYLEAQGGTQ